MRTKIKKAVNILTLKPKVYYENKRAAKKGLPATLTVEEWADTLNHFKGKCYITGEGGVIAGGGIQIEHNVPLAWREGGTTKDNLLPMSAALNKSKSDKNVFTWFYEGCIKGKFTEEQRKNFEKGQLYLAKLHGYKTLEEYRHYYDSLDPRFKPNPLAK